MVSNIRTNGCGICTLCMWDRPTGRDKAHYKACYDSSNEPGSDLVASLVFQMSSSMQSNTKTKTSKKKLINYICLDELQGYRNCFEKNKKNQQPSVGFGRVSALCNPIHYVVNYVFEGCRGGDPRGGLVMGCLFPDDGWANQIIGGSQY